jgi:hypothetical protein
MRTRTTLTAGALLTGGALLGWLAASRMATNVQAQDKPPAAGKPRMAAEIPPAITCPGRRLAWASYSSGPPGRPHFRWFRNFFRLGLV